MPKFVIVCLDDDDHPCCGVADEGLTQIWTAGIKLIEMLRLVEEISPWDLVDIHYFSTDWGVPMVVGQCAEEGLENSALHKKIPIVMLDSMLAKHIRERVLIVFEPEGTTYFDLFCRLFGPDNRSRFAGVDDNIARGGFHWTASSDLSFPSLELSQKPVMPTFEAIVGLTWIAFKLRVVNT